MKNRIASLMFLLFLPFSSVALAEESIVDAVTKACKSEIDTFCKNVTMGEGRMLACFYAHEDKLSGECGFTLYKAASVLEQLAAAFNHVAQSCELDIKTLCSNVKPGEGRIVGCLQKNSGSISEQCTKALNEVGAK